MPNPFHILHNNAKKENNPTTFAHPKLKKDIITIKRKHRLRYFLERAGIYANEKIIVRVIFNLCIAVTLFFAAYSLYIFVTTQGYNLSYILFMILAIWFLGFPIVLFVVWASFYLLLDIKTYKRRQEIEDVLPDFLQLTASNIRAGMIIDKAMWYAVRPRFGILAREIEMAAKETIAGIDIVTALTNFSERFDSIILKRAISLILEGISTGGNMGELVNKIAVEIDEAKVLQKEMSANVSNYVIFIGFAAVVAAPVLFALGFQFLKVIQNVSLNSNAGSAGTISFISFSGGGISTTDFTIFAVSCLVITSFFSSLIVSTIKKGNLKSSFKYIPFYILATLLIFFLASKALDSALSNLF